RNSSSELIDLVVYLLDIHQSEVILCIALELVLVAHSDASLFYGGIKRFVVVRLSVELQALAAAKHPAKGRKRYVNVVVQRIAEHRAALLFDPNYSHGQFFDFDLPANRIETDEELISQVSANHANHRRMLNFVWEQKTPLGNGLVPNLSVVGCHARDLCPEQLLALVLQIGARTCLGAYFFARRTFVEQPIEVVPIKSLVPLNHLLPLFLCHVSDVGYSRDHEMVDSQEL